ncbi:uncharacterized protein BJ171DRAFT_484539 [Polychytrium aggregatum]|uniref:uncharacterized protein n=1 Tax=Polychytrium aggregatum TaxID=110093 RepID=UPI0022FE6403|nr:uncharacterized protein BJ171DRAFT_484539 [Polychytrium aggregatum]KAI9209612.1 hypothetical protein BJ171DRAFT_484539 [Polychytrium aggregatum]
MTLLRAFAAVRAPSRSVLRSYSTAHTASSSSSLGSWAKLAVGLSAASVAAVYLYDSRAWVHRGILMPTIHFLLDAETAHRAAILAAKYHLCPVDRGVDSDVLATEIWGKKISNPIGLAAGFDKHAEAIDAMFGVGFGAVEIGSVTPQPQPGNPLPRMFRLPEDRAVINRYGFNSEGHQAVYDRLKSRIRNFLYRSASGSESLPKSLKENRLLGVNLGKNKTSPADSDDDYIKGIEKLGEFADYIVVNISSPNTPGLRALQRREPMERLMQEVKDSRDKLSHRPPVVVKIAPDLTDEELDDIAQVVMKVGIDGVIISNTTISRPATLKSDPRLIREMGGLSGPPIHSLSVATLSKFYKITGGSVPLIGCGGVLTGEDVIRFAKAGASLVQLYSSMAYEGPGLIADLKDEVTRILNRENKTWNDIVGLDHK